MDLGLHGKRAIVTGGSLGIGKAIARELAREGVDVAIVARTKDRLEQAAQELAAESGRRIIPLAADVTSREQVEGMVAHAVARLGGLDILVNSGSPPGGSAGATGPIETVVDEDLLHDFNVKYVGALRCARAVIPHMKEQRWGRIINISGTNARNAGNLSGGARNTSLVHFTKTLAVQLGRFGITVNCIHPGITRTERTPRLLAARAAELRIGPEEVEKRDFADDWPRGNAIGRMVDASEIAYVATFLASDRSWAVSGELVVATGGRPGSVLLMGARDGPLPTRGSAQPGHLITRSSNFDAVRGPHRAGAVRAGRDAGGRSAVSQRAADRGLRDRRRAWPTRPTRWGTRRCGWPSIISSTKDTSASPTSRCWPWTWPTARSASRSAAPSTSSPPGIPSGSPRTTPWPTS